MKTPTQQAHTRQKRQRVTAALLMLSAVLLTVLISPLLLVAVAGLFQLNWQQLSDVGQSYTGFSVILSAVAVIVTALALQSQVRQARVAQEHSLRTNQLELIKIALSSDDLLETMIPSTEDADQVKHNSRRQHVFMTARLRHVQLQALANDYSESHVTAMLRGEYFTTPHAAEHWERVRSLWIAGSTHSADRKFVRGVDAARSLYLADSTKEATHISNAEQ